MEEPYLMEELVPSPEAYNKTINSILKAAQLIRVTLPEVVDDDIWTPSEIGDGPLRGFSRPVSVDQFSLQLAYQVWRDMAMLPRGPMPLSMGAMKLVRVEGAPPE